MSRINKFLILLIIVMALSCWFYIAKNPSYKGPEFLEDPIQVNLVHEMIQIVDENGERLELTLVAEYSGDFAIQGVKNYHSDGAAAISPVDFILSWGELPSEVMDEAIKYSQSGRWFYYEYSAESMVDKDYISAHAANTHIIPSDEHIEDMVRSIRRHDYVYIEGYLAIVHFKSGDWCSSDTRLDTGSGSCEILYVTNIKVY